MLARAGLEEQIGAGIDEEGNAGRVRRRSDGLQALALVVDLVEPFAADDLVLQIAADRAAPDRFGRRRADLRRRQPIAALQIDRYRQRHRRRDPFQIVDREVQRQLLSILETEGRGDGPAPGSHRLRPGIGHRSGAAGVPGVEQDQGRARPVQRSEYPGLFTLHHRFPRHSRASGNPAFLIRLLRKKEA